MKQYNDTTYKYAHIIELDNSEISKIDLAICKQPRETLSNFYNRQTVKPTVLINAGLFSFKDGRTLYNVIDEGKVVSEYKWFKWGFGISKEHNKFVFGSSDNKAFTDFMTGYPVLVNNGKSCAPWTYATELNYKALRTMVGYNDNKVFIVMVDKPGLGFNAMASLMIRIGCKYAINLDGGGSSRCLVNGKVKNTPTENRAVDSVMAFYVKSNATSSATESTNKPATSTSTKPSTSTSTTKPSTSKPEYYTYKVKKGDSWWAISNRETGNGGAYIKLQQYNNWPAKKTLTIGTVIKIPYSLSKKKPQ